MASYSKGIVNSSRNCSVLGCPNTETQHKQDVCFYRFPNHREEAKRRLLWIQALRRAEFDGISWRPSPYSRVCSLHFEGGSKSDDPCSRSYIPSIFPANPEASKPVEEKQNDEKSSAPASPTGNPISVALNSTGEEVGIEDIARKPSPSFVGDVMFFSSSMGSYHSSRKCSVMGCDNSEVKNGKQVFFHRFPGRESEKERKEMWIRALNQTDASGNPWRPTQNSRVCSAHFLGGLKSNDPTNPAYVPSIFPNSKIPKIVKEVLIIEVPSAVSATGNSDALLEKQIAEEIRVEDMAETSSPLAEENDIQSESTKMSKGKLVTRSITTTRPVEMTLNLDCIEDSLSEVQQLTRIRSQQNYDKVKAKLEELVKEQGAQLRCQAGLVSGYQYSLPGNVKSSTALMQKPHPQSVPLNVSQGKNQPIKVNVINNAQSNNPQGNIQLVVNPRIILGTVAPTQAQGSTTTTTTTAPTLGSVQGSPALNQSENYQHGRQSRRPLTLQVQQPPQQKSDTTDEPSSNSTRTRAKACNTVASHVIASNKATTSPQSVPNVRVKNVAKPQQSVQSTVWPTEQTSIGGIAVGAKNAVGEQIDEAKKNLPDGREITFNKMNGGRTFPSLVVVARPHLRTKDFPLNLAQKERSDLDQKVKSVLMYSATKFAEWLIQRGLVRSEQYCQRHSTATQKTKLKLGMYSDSSGTFPYSGGYVWISSCCPDRFVSVFCGSLFQGAPHTPTVLLKLIYHWACQTNVPNVVSWVKVSNVYVKNFYANLRSVCTAAVWDKAQMMGGKGAMIQVGVISLGTTSQDGNLRQVKVEVLGVLNPETSELRLRACEPLYDGDRSFKRRFNNILYPLKEWVHKDSKIVTDYTVDRSTLQEMGFNQVIQSAFSDQNPRNMKSNYHMMDYLRKIVPRMFQNTLSLLSRQMIQQFLDELVWREMFGTTAARAFDNIILHIAEQTRVETFEGLLDRLARTAANPFKDWSYSPKRPGGNAGSTPTTQTRANVGESSTRQSQKSRDSPVPVPVAPQYPTGPRRGRKRVANTASPEPDIKRSALDPKSKDRDDNILMNALDVPLEKFYYGTMEGDRYSLARETKSSCVFKCFLCSTVMRCNTEVMAHMVNHVPARVPGQPESPVCQYCCAAFSSKHQMTTHVFEAHTKFGHQDGGDMVVCAICEEKFFGNGTLLLNHMATMHNPSEMPYRCESCLYRTSSHKDIIDHYYQVHEKGEGLQCPYCLKVISFIVDGRASASNVHAYLLHMQRHIVRREQGRGNKCSRCCLWFNQKSSLKNHQDEMHQTVTGARIMPYTKTSTGIMVSRQRLAAHKRIDLESPLPEFPEDDKLNKWNNGPISVVVSSNNLSCQECEEDIDEPDHYPGEQRCQQCRYVTCCWRAFKEHQRQIHNERPMTSLVVPSPLINIPLEKKMRCPCGTFATNDGNLLAAHLVKCNRMSAFPTEEPEQRTGMLDSLGLVPKST